MTQEEALSLINEYCAEKDSMRFVALRPFFSLRARKTFKDAKGMAARWPVDGSKAKAMRWLGYMQGVLVCAGYYDLDEVKEHSRRKYVQKPECSCVRQETISEDNPKRHYVDCPCWGKDIPNTAGL